VWLASTSLDFYQARWDRSAGVITPSFSPDEPMTSMLR